MEKIDYDHEFMFKNVFGLNVWLHFVKYPNPHFGDDVMFKQKLFLFECFSVFCYIGNW